MKKYSIRLATQADEAVFREIAEASFAKYLERMDRKPFPMLDDYGTHINAGHAWVLEDIDGIEGYVVLIPQNDCLMLDTIAVRPKCQHSGYGRALVAFAENKARGMGWNRITVYTNEAMLENLAWYPALGYSEYDRRVENGYNRVFFQKYLS